MHRRRIPPPPPPTHTHTYTHTSPPHSPRQPLHPLVWSVVTTRPWPIRRKNGLALTVWYHPEQQRADYQYAANGHRLTRSFGIWLNKDFGWLVRQFLSWLRSWYPIQDVPWKSCKDAIHVSFGRRHKLYLLWQLFQLGPPVTQWYLWHSKAWFRLQVLTMYWTDRWQTNDTDHS